MAVARAHAAQAEAFAAEFGAATSYADWRDMIVDPAVDAVYVATPVHLHAEQTIAAAEAGKHVLCEKPMGARRGRMRSHDRGLPGPRRALGIAYYRHFYPIVQRMKALLAEGEIGDPVYAQINAFEWFDLPPDHPRAWFLQRRSRRGRAHVRFRLPSARSPDAPVRTTFGG